MARLIDHAPFLDIEIIEDWMFFYSSRQFELTDPQTFATLLAITDSVGAATTRRTKRYADDRASHNAPAAINPRLAGNTVAAQGVRLKKGLPVRRFLFALAATTVMGAALLGILWLVTLL